MNAGRAHGARWIARKGAGRRTRRTGRTPALMAAGLLVALSALLSPSAVSATAQDGVGAKGDPGVDPIDFTIVVDQSDSLSGEDLRREVDAVATIAQAELSQKSQATVIGFGSAEKHGQVAAEETCPRTVLNAAGRQRISECAQDLAHPDRKVIGPGTDHPAALAQAVDRLAEGDPKTPRVIFLLTDGRLDVTDSLNYGDDPQARQDNARRALHKTLADARKNRIQVWPLGFGDQIDRAALRDMAKGGYAEGCANLPGAVPEMRVVKNSGDLLESLQRTFAAARCAAVEIGETGVPPVDLEVTIPAVATDGSITVSKGSPEVAVTYYDPDHHKVPRQGTFDGSTFELSGRNTAVEALRVIDPRPGTWRVHLEPAPDGPAREAAVSAIWQGRLLSSVTVTPPSPHPGESVLVQARLQTRESVTIDDPDQVAGVRATARLEGDGFDPMTVPLRDDGADGDERAHDLVFSGRITVPKAAGGALAFTSEMAAPGVVADQRPFHSRVTEGTPPVQAVITIEDAAVHPGGTVTGTVRVENSDDQRHDLRLELRDTDKGSVDITPSTVRAEPGGGKTVPLAITFGKDVPLGRSGGTVAVVDEADGGRILHQTFLAVTVTAPPTWWDRYHWVVLGALVVALVTGAWVVLWARATRRRHELYGHTVELRQHGRKLDEQPIRGRPRVFFFRVERGRGGHPALVAARSAGGSTYDLRREPNGTLHIKPPRGSARELRPGQSFPIDDETEIVVRATTTRSRPPGGAGPGSFFSFPRRPSGPGPGPLGGRRDGGTGPRNPGPRSDNRNPHF